MGGRKNRVRKKEKIEKWREEWGRRKEKKETDKRRKQKEEGGEKNKSDRKEEKNNCLRKCQMFSALLIFDPKQQTSRKMM